MQQLESFVICPFDRVSPAFTQIQPAPTDFARARNCGKDRPRRTPRVPIRIPSPSGCAMRGILGPNYPRTQRFAPTLPAILPAVIDDDDIEAEETERGSYVEDALRGVKGSKPPDPDETRDACPTAIGAPSAAVAALSISTTTRSAAPTAPRAYSAKGSGPSPTRSGCATSARSYSHRRYAYSAATIPRFAKASGPRTARS